MIEKISTCSVFQSEFSRKLDDKLKFHSDQVETVRNDVLRRADKIKEMVDQHANKLLENIEYVRCKKQKEIESEREDIERHLTMLESFQRYANEMKERGSAVDICRTFQDMNARADDLLMNHADITDLISRDSNCQFISFIPSDFENLISTDNNDR